MNETGKQYWRGIEDSGLGKAADELVTSIIPAGTPDWLHREFPEGAFELDAPSRRTLFKLMGASLGLAGLTACSRPVEKIFPASKGVEDVIPGNPTYYSTVTSLGGCGTGLLVESHEGRPTKIEGNPEHPFSKGACSAFAQASILGLYDPDRCREVLNDGRKSSWEEFANFAREHFDPSRRSQRIRFLSGRINSPSLAALREQTLAKYPDARWVEYEPLSEDEAIAGAGMAFGRAVRPLYHFDHADVILSLDCDFLGLDAPTVTYTRDFAKGRRVASEKDTMNRLYVVESQFSVTGGMADHRLPLRSSDIPAFALDLARQLKVLPPALTVLNGTDLKLKWSAALARDLNRNRGRCLIVAGPRQPAIVHALAHAINQALGNAGKTVAYLDAVDSPHGSALQSLASEMRAGQVDALVILGGNPVYDAPADLEFGAALSHVPATVYAGIEPNETAALATWNLPEAHYLEAWSDARALDGTVSIQQPLIRPLFGGRTHAEILALILDNKEQSGYDIVRKRWLAQWPAASAEKLWRKALHDGVIPNTAFERIEPAIDLGRVAFESAKISKPRQQDLEITFYPSASTYDGRFANNGWLQEAPDPITKLTWDNAALLSPSTAKRLGVNTEDVVVIESTGRHLEMPVWIQPGHADGAISVALGYGRTHCGRVGKDVGHNAYLLRTSSAPHTAPVTIQKTGRTYPLAATQHHHSMEGRPIVREASLEQYRKDPDFAAKAAPEVEHFSIFGEHSYTEGNQWGMAIDLNACVGCNACVLACQAENNIAIVGKDQVRRGREMHWIRMDRYYAGPEDNPESVTQPVACQQCEIAPCETVCPVAATSHSPEGLNDMAYNRCVGTRYCANNCPYKVRRFNFLDYHKEWPEVEKMVFNPDVTVRMRGVMEKCTYCVQRIQEKKIQAKVEGHRPIRDGEIVTACQQTCPAEAIVFGNINDPASRVSQLSKQNRDYALLGELNTRPRTTYLAKLRNPNPELS